MVKGTILVIVPAGVSFNYSNLRELRLPPGWNDYLDGMIYLMTLPEGGSLHIGRKAIEVIDILHEDIHKIKKLTKEVEG